MRSGDRQTERETEWNGVAEKEARKSRLLYAFRLLPFSLAVGIGANDSSYRSRE